MTPKFVRQRGFLLPSFLIVILLLSVLAYSQARTLMMESNQKLAEATGNYMLSVRGGVLKALGTYEAALGLVDTTKAPTGTYPTPPAWAVFTGDEQTVQVKDLKASGLLPNDFPERAPLGRSVYVKLLRTPGICPGVGCEVRAFVVSCWPITEPLPRDKADPATCPAAPANLRPSEVLVHTLISTTQGFGAENVRDATKVRGTLMNLTADVLGIPAGSGGHVVVAASLNATSFNQFVRQGDIRPIFLNNTLDVVGAISTETGLNLNTQIAPGSTCQGEGMFATSTAGTLAQCKSGQWFDLADYVVTRAQTVANGTVVGTPVCPASMQAFSYASLQTLDVTMTGSDVNVRGTQSGTINGTGATNKSGSVTVTGSYAGTLVSSPDSKVRVNQVAEVVGGTLVITPATANAKATVMQGCRING
jgi:type II secretory pathway pseudopilin PulG